MNKSLATFEQALYGFMASHVLFTAEKLGVFDSLISGQGSTSGDLARQNGGNPSAMEKLLIGAIAIGLLDRTDKGYAIPADLLPFFDRESPDYMCRGFGHYRDVSTKIFHFLADAVVENAPQWSRYSPEAGSIDPFSQIYSDPENTAIFLESMWGLGYGPAKQILSKFSLKNFSELVDIGGASGSFAIAALEANPSLLATVFDLSIVEPHLQSKADLHRVSDRLLFTSGDMFRDAFPPADLYAMGYILSDWSREQGTTLLQKVYDSLPNGGAVLILEKLFDEDKRGPLSTAMMNLVMLLETYGEHHSVSEYFQWLQEIGFGDCKVVRSEGEKHMIVGYKG